MTIGNRITNNALKADNGKLLIKKALKEIEAEFGWKVNAKNSLFSGVYYDSAKVGSFIIRAKNIEGAQAVIKLQLYPLAFDEGYIIRHIETQNKSKQIRFPKIYNDEAWSKNRGYGFLIFEDLSGMPNLWKVGYPVTLREMKNHKKFLNEFLHHVLPVKPWLPYPTSSPVDYYKEAFKHFNEIATKSSHYHISQKEIAGYRDKYFEILEKMTFGKSHFSHAHLSGFDVKYDKKNEQYIVMANLYWSFRPTYYEIIFPVWVNLMHIRNENLEFKDFLTIVNKWGDVWKNDLYDHDPTATKEYWFHFLTRAVLTIMLDLGSSEWKRGEKKSKKALLNNWKEFFDWLIETKLS